ncbi:Uncharacterised protein [Neisseria animaloris]|uniref:Uncharacterized protein n=1 Tax=Neisseria animaloris TaxID=326522 RepID=A0A448UE07_9NEIS|nr:Uncharacterised protein [Neisseria animaloris]
MLSDGLDTIICLTQTETMNTIKKQISFFTDLFLLVVCSIVAA